MGNLVPLLLSVGFSYVVVYYVYLLFFHPLAKCPGPLFCRISRIPSWYHVCKGDRHHWLLSLFEKYGPKVRVMPNEVLFWSPAAGADIYNYKANVERSSYYHAYKADEKDINTVNVVGRLQHARKRRILNTAFTDQSLRASAPIMEKHIDRWGDIVGPSSTEEWSKPVDFPEWLSYLVFDIFSDLFFGRSFEVKEPGPNLLRQLPHQMEHFMVLFYKVGHSPFNDVFLWLQAHGLSRLNQYWTPKPIQHFYDWMLESVKEQVKMEEQCEKEGIERRKDMFHFLRKANDPWLKDDTPALSAEELLAETKLLSIAGTDTSATTLCSLFWYITHPRYQHVYERLVQEIRSTFDSAEEIHQGDKLRSCVYLYACISESLRITPAAVDEFPRVVCPGGTFIEGEFYPEGVIVGTAGWSMGHHKGLYGDPEIYRPERWIADPKTGVTAEDVAQIKRGTYPFLKGPGDCVGQKLAWLQMQLFVGRMLWRMDVKRAAKEVGGWTAMDEADPPVYDIVNAHICVKTGPVLQFKKRVL